MFCWHLLLFCKWLVVTCPDLTTLETQLDAFSAVMTLLTLWVHLSCVHKAEPAFGFEKVHGGGDLKSGFGEDHVLSTKVSVFVLAGFHPFGETHRGAKVHTPPCASSESAIHLTGISKSTCRHVIRGVFTRAVTHTSEPKLRRKRCPV